MIATSLVRRAQVREHLQSVGVRAQSRRRTVALGEERQPVVDDVVGEDAAVRVFRRLGRIERQHVGQRAFVVDGFDGFFARVAAGVAQLMDEHVDPPLPGRGPARWRCTPPWCHRC